MNIGSLKITSQLLSLISEIDEFKGSWQTLQNLAPERLSNLRKVAMIESIGLSTRIEGAKLRDHEVEALLSRLSAFSFQSRDEEEVLGYQRPLSKYF